MPYSSAFAIRCSLVKKLFPKRNPASQAPFFSSPRADDVRSPAVASRQGRRWRRRRRNGTSGYPIISTSRSHARPDARREKTHACAAAQYLLVTLAIQKAADPSTRFFGLSTSVARKIGILCGLRAAPEVGGGRMCYSF